ncbi:unnamed protein product [Effrenium voratum]|nr:unnamed protein product [Effrenium voratum]
MTSFGTQTPKCLRSPEPSELAAAWCEARSDFGAEDPGNSVEVLELELLDFRPPDFTLRVRCGGGLYVRTLGRDLAEAVGTVGHVASLRRSAVGDFREADCLSLEQAQMPEKIATRLRRCKVKRPRRRARSAERGVAKRSWG